jgi:hypothetical protein
MVILQSRYPPKDGEKIICYYKIIDFMGLKSGKSASIPSLGWCVYVVVTRSPDLKLQVQGNIYVIHDFP